MFVFVTPQVQRRANGTDDADDEMGEGDEGRVLGALAAKAAVRAQDFDTTAADRAQRAAAAGVAEGTGTCVWWRASCLLGGAGRCADNAASDAVCHHLPQTWTAPGGPSTRSS